LLDWAQNTPEGQQWVKDMGETGLPLESLVDETVSLVDEMLPTSKHLSIAARRDLSPDDVDEMWTQAKAMSPEEAQAKFEEARGVAQQEIEDLGRQIEDLDARIADRRSKGTSNKRERAYLDRLTKQRNNLITERQNRLASDSTVQLQREVHVTESQRLSRPTLTVAERAFQDIVEPGQRPRGVQAAYEKVKEGRDRYFHAFSAVPEGVWSRHPLFVMKFQRELNNILQSKG